jgi:hypothetical protein
MLSTHFATHFGSETAYAFTGVERLVADFWSDVRALRGGK